ncbi:hypothetical protein KM043_006599 [Ampulex compressa]|nr:hypothetical protein KM043_006599 [Ampulex compressa]
MAVIITTKGGGTREGAEAEESAKGMDCHKFKQELTFGVGLFPQVGARICIALSVDTAGEERVSVQSVSGCALVKKGEPAGSWAREKEREGEIKKMCKRIYMEKRERKRKCVYTCVKKSKFERVSK